MSSDNESSSSEGSIEYLMNTRERRSNAGNRLQKLLEQEIKDTRARTEVLNDDDIDLLFQEDEDDQEFDLKSEQEEDNEQEGNDEDEVDEPTTSKKHTKHRRKSITSQSEDELNESDAPSIGKEKQVNDEDLMLSSDSDINASDEDEDDEAGEKELQRQERLKKRKKRVPTVIKKRVKIDTSTAEKLNKESHSVHEQYTAESLLTTSRRTSKRASAVANKLKVYNKLAKAEEKRKEIQEKLQRRKEKQEKTHKLTQEDRLRIAEQTEKLNLLSLDKFKEQELSKKQTRLALQQRQKLKFKQDELIIDYLTTTWQTSPLVELEDYKYWNEQLQKREKKKKKKYSRRTKKQIEEDNARALAEEKGEVYNPASSTLPDIKQENEGTGEETSSDAISEPKPSEPTSLEPTEETNKISSSDHNTTPINEELSNDVILEDQESPLLNSSSTVETSSKEEPKASKETSITKQVSFATQPQITMINTEEPPSAVETPKEATPDISNPSSPDSSLTPVHLVAKTEPTEEEEKEVTIYEGPYQQVSKTFVTVYKFSTQNYNHSSVDIPDYDFLPKSSTSLAKGKQNVEPEVMQPILRSKLGSTDDDPESLYDEQKVSLPIIEASLIPDLKFLDGFPSFGEFDKKVTNQVDVEDIKVETIKITTKAPTGIYINNIKKHCFINNNDCQYFDPKLGVPYSDLASYKIIQDIQKPDGGYKWFGFENGGIYLSVDQKPAKGVPEGF
ncbi:vacuolar protein sorting-associated protein 72 [Monosporozyma unispora]